MGRKYERTYEAPHYRVWDALMATLADLGYVDVVPNLSAGNIAYPRARPCRPGVDSR